MAEIIPTIIAQNIKEVEEKVRLIEHFVPLAQLDIMDGEFVSARTWNSPEQLASIATPLRFETDLMAVNPDETVGPWLAAEVMRIFVQIEPFLERDANARIHALSRRVREAGKEFGLILNPETPVNELMPFANMADRILFRGGTPGSYGRPFQKEVFQKIRTFHRAFPHIPLAIDGGVRRELIRPLKEAGITSFAVGSAIWNAPDIKEAIAALRREAE